jgi:Cu(I)-responsive transcriptional regulator
MFITEISKKLKITTRAIRHYEEIGLVNSKRLENNYRYFDQVNLDKLKFLARARKLGFSLDECKELILLFQNDNRKSENVREIAKNKLKLIKKQINELKDLEKSLNWLVLKCPGDNKPDCPIIDELAKG